MTSFPQIDSNRHRTIHTLLLLIVLLLSPTGTPLAADTATTKPLEIQFFYSDTCPHCHRQMQLMQPLAANNPELTIHFHEIARDAEIWKKFLKEHAITAASVPRTQIGETAFIGYSEEAENLQYSDQYQAYFGNPTQIIKAIEQQLGHKVDLGKFVRPDGVDRLLPPYWPLLIVLLYCASYFIFKRRLKEKSSMRLWLGGLATTTIIAVFLMLGNVSDAKIQAFAERFPYPLFVFTIALADGFNPCAFTVLIILLSLLTHTRGRRDMAIIGLTFIATSAVMYFVFIMAMVLIGSLFIERYGQILMVVLGIVITLAGLVNIKDYFFLHQGFSLGLSKEQQTLFSRKASAIVRDLKQGRGRLTLAIMATITLAIFVNIVELGCTAMLPAVYMTTLVKKFTDYASYIFWTAFYAAVYIIPLLLILGNFIYLFNSVRISEETARRLKLAAGSFMLFFGLVMVFRPGLLSFG